MTTRHHEIDRWADFARGLVSDAEREAMRRHLDDGCARCARQLAAAKRLVALARDQTREEPPADLLRIAKSIAALAPSRVASSERARPRQVLLRRVFDSTIEPLAAGLRQQAGSDQQLVFESEDHSLWLQIEPEADGVRLRLGGQLVGPGGQPLAGVPACLEAAGGATRYLVTGDEGEFDIAAELEGDAELRFLVDDELRVTVKLPDA